jgi:hypothetical protein
MKEKPKNFVIGALLIAAGVAVGVFNALAMGGESVFGGGVAKLWPFAVMLLGFVLSVYAYSTRKKRDSSLLLFLGAFFLVSSVILFILALSSWEHIRVLWPGFLSALGLGFLTVYLAGDGKKAILVLSLFLIAASVVIWILYSLRSQYGFVIGACLFVIGVGFLTRSLMREA